MRAPYKLRTLDEVALFLHLVGVVTLFAGTAVAGVGLAVARRRERSSESRAGDAWVATALGLVVLGAVLGAFGGQRPKRARLLAERGGDAEELRRLLDDPLSMWLNAAAAAAYLAVLALMVWKP